MNWKLFPLPVASAPVYLRLTPIRIDGPFFVYREIVPDGPEILPVPVIGIFKAAVLEERITLRFIIDPASPEREIHDVGDAGVAVEARRRYESAGPAS
jgi:hypothetical protein